MSHKLFDDIEDAVAEVQDEIAEQGGRLKLNDLKPRRYISTIQDLLNDTQQLTIRRKNLLGVKSIQENLTNSNIF